MLNTSMIRKAFCCATNKVGLLLVLAALCFLGNAASLWGQSVQRSVFLQRGPLPAQADPIPNHLWQQAMVYGQPINYQPQLGADASDSVQPESMDGEVIEDFTDGSLAEDAFDPYGLVRVWANGVPSRVITAQRYSDAYWRFNIDLLALERHNLSEIRQFTNNTPPGATFKNAAPTGGMRISASADLFYSFDLEFAWLGNITWVGRSSNEFNWSAVNGGSGHVYNQGSASSTDGLLISTIDNKTNFGSNLNAFEINTRFRWVGTTSPFTGAWILGARYVRFTESAYANNNKSNITIQSSTSAAAPISTVTSIRTEAENNLVGFQGGGEWFWSVFRGVMIGGNLKGGIYGNLAQNESIISNVTDGGGNRGNAEYHDSSTTGAFFGEANVMVNAHLGHNWYIRGGYTGLFLTNVSSAVSAVQEDFQTVSTNNSLIASGFYGGLEWKY